MSSPYLTGAVFVGLLCSCLLELDILREEALSLGLVLFLLTSSLTSGSLETKTYIGLVITAELLQTYAHQCIHTDKELFTLSKDLTINTHQHTN